MCKRKKNKLILWSLLVALLIGFFNLRISFSSIFAGTQIETDWNPAEKAVELGDTLLSVDNILEIEVAIYDVLELIGIGVYDVYGVPIRIGNERSEDDFFLYDFEVGLLADSFLKQNYLSFEAIAESWRSMGIPIVPLASSSSELVTALAVEEALRELRKTAEAEPDNPEGFIVRLIDELGNREQFPFDLLDEDDDEPEVEGLAAGMKDVVEEQLALVRKEAIQDGDHEMLARLEILESEEGKKALIDAMLQGDMFVMMRLLMGEDEIDELATEMREQQREMSQDDDVHEGMVRFLGDASQFFSGQDVDFIQINIDYMKDEMEHNLNLREQRIDEMKKEVSDTYDYMKNIPANRYSLAVYNANLFVIEANVEVDLLEDKHIYISNKVEPWEEEYKDIKKITEEIESQFGLPFTDTKEVSKLYFDPIQALLLHIDMFLEPRELDRVAVSNKPKSIVDHIKAFFGNLSPLVLAQNCQIGNSQGNYPDAYGALNNLLSTARSVRGIIQDIKNVGLNQSYSNAAKNIVRGAIQTAATELVVDLYYHEGSRVTKAGSQNPTASIHMRHNEPRPDKYIRIEARIESPFLDALSDILNDIDPSRACGPIRDLLGMPDPLGSLHDIADFDKSGVPIRFEPESEFLFNFLLYASGWDAIHGTTFTKNTNNQGVADGIFYLNKEAPDVGGWTEVTASPLRVQAMVNASEAAIYNPARWGLAVGEELFRPVQTHVQIRIEHHIPVERVGKLELTRNVTETGSVRESDDNGFSELSRNGQANLVLTINNLRMDKEGNFIANYTANLSGNWTIVNTSGNYFTGSDDLPSVSYTETTSRASFTAGASGTSRGVDLIVDPRSDTYLVWPGPLLAELLSALEVIGEETITTVVTTKDGKRTETDRESIEGVGDLEDFIIMHVFDHSALFIYPKPQFSRNYDLRDSVSVTRAFPNLEIARRFGAPEPDFTHFISTNISWDLKGTGVQ